MAGRGSQFSIYDCAVEIAIPAVKRPPMTVRNIEQATRNAEMSGVVRIFAISDIQFPIANC